MAKTAPSSSQPSKVTVRIERRVTLPNYEHEIVSVMADTYVEDTDEARTEAQDRLTKKLRRALIKQCRAIAAE